VIPDTHRRLALRVTLKLLTLTALLVITYLFISGNDEGVAPDPAIAPVQIELADLRPAKPQRQEWAGGPLQLLRMDDGGQLHIFYDRGGSLGCPLSWQPPGSTKAQLQPWPGGFRDQCSSTWYRYDGEVLPDQSVGHDLQSPPYRLKGDDLLEIGVNVDNAPPAN
jgi:hypothetical protein